MKRLLPALLSLFLFFQATAQTATRPKQNGWHLLDPQQDGYYGISLNRAYELLKGRSAQTVVVAVIDSGIDTAHEDLKPVLWVNPKEIAGNGLDDDGNGYVDDVHGWNFCGSPDGENLARNTHEVARVYHGWRSEFEGKKEKDIPADRRYLYGQWVKADALIEKDYAAAKKSAGWVNNLGTALESSAKIINQYLQLTAFTAAQVKPLLKSTSATLAQAAGLWDQIFAQNPSPELKSTAVLEEIDRYRNDIRNKIDRKEKQPEDFRGTLVKDRYTDINDRIYGNNNLKSGSGDHGTGVAGIIAAVRGNGLGMDGIADHVRIMAIRAVPGGDEHDKDVALAIRYAVDNGASIINMSFGKPVSPYKQFVDDAIRYAASKGVLLIHAAGNDGENITENVFYPNPFYLDGTRATNFLSVGASGDLSTGALAAPFSNYSATSVDLFAPGMNIYSTATDNRYTANDGTSVAAPVVTGVAALLRSYFPKLTPEQLIRLLMTTSTKRKENVPVPGEEGRKVSFAGLSVSGGIVNAYEAVKAAANGQW